MATKIRYAVAKPYRKPKRASRFADRSHLLEVGRGQRIMMSAAGHPRLVGRARYWVLPRGAVRGSWRAPGWLTHSSR